MDRASSTTSSSSQQRHESQQQPAVVAAGAVPSIPQTSFIHGTVPMDDERSHAGAVYRPHAHNTSDEEEDDLFLDEETVPLPPRPSSSRAAAAATASTSVVMSAADVGIFQRLDAEYDRAMEEREVAYAARYNSVRQSACFAVAFMVLYMMLGTLYFMQQTDWTLEEALFFGVYTITTVGYGNLENPETPAFQIYTIFFILIGIATLTIMVAQVYQCIALEAGRAQHSRDHLEMMRRGLDIMARNKSNHHGDSHHNDILPPNHHHHHQHEPATTSSVQDTLNHHFPVPMVDRCFRCLDKCRNFLMTNEFGRGLSVLLPFLTLIAIGASVVGTLEQWTAVESIYFAVVSLTTVGFGDYFPTRTSSRIFCIIWLPFSVGFMSLYLGNIAAFYIRLSDRNIARIERHLRRKMDNLKQRTEREREQTRKRALRGQPDAIGDSALLAEEVVVPSTQGRSSSASSQNQERRTRVLQNHLGHGKHIKSALGDAPESTSTMATMKNVIDAVHSNMRSPSHGFAAGPESEFLSYRSSKVVSKSSLQQKSGSVRKPSFALRVLIQERFAEIIAREVAGFQSDISIQEATLSVTIESLKNTAEKWLVPRRARRAFRAVSFEALYFVGEHALITRGANALYELNPFEFHGLFAPLLAAFEDADTMEGWLGSTEILAQYDLRSNNKNTPAPAPVSGSGGTTRAPSQGTGGTKQPPSEKLIV